MKKGEFWHFQDFRPPNGRTEWVLLFGWTIYSLTMTVNWSKNQDKNRQNSNCNYAETTRPEDPD